MENTDLYTFIFTNQYKKDIEKHKKSGVKSLLNKLKTFIEELETNPTFGTGKPEGLKGFGERSVWSRRIDQKHRLIYEVFEEEKIVKMLSCYGHYED